MVSISQQELHPLSSKGGFKEKFVQGKTMNCMFFPFNAEPKPECSPFGWIHVWRNDYGTNILGYGSLLSRLSAVQLVTTTTREYFEWLILVPFGILLFLLSNDPNFFYSFPLFFCFCFQLLWNIKIPFRRRRRKERHPSVKGITRLTRHAVGVVRFRFIFKRKSAVPVGIQRPKCVPTNLWKRLIVVVRLVLDVWDTWKL